MTTIEEKRCERLLIIRNEIGLKQNEFANELEISQGHLSDIENKRKTVSDMLLNLICLKYNINKKWFLDGIGDMHNPVANNKFSSYLASIENGNDDFIKDFVEVYMELDSDSKKALKILLDKMVQRQREKE